MRDKSKKTGAELGVILSYFLVSVVILYPLVLRLFSELPFASNGDVRLSLAILFSNLKKIALGNLDKIYQLPLLFPFSHTLSAGINLFGQTLLVLPFYLLGVRNLYFIYNFLTFFSYIAAGYGAYLFTREWVTDRRVAWLAGALYILLPFRVHNIPHLNLMFSFPIPLAFLYFSRFLKKQGTKDLVFFLIFLYIQFLFDLSYGVYLGISLGIFFLLRQITTEILPRTAWLKLVAFSLLFILAVFLIFSPYLNPKTSFSTLDEVRSISTASFSTPLSFYTNWSYLLLFLKRIFWNESPRSPGITVFIFFLLAFVPYLTDRKQKVAALACSVFLIAPAIFTTLVFDRLPAPVLDRICGVSLLLFFLSLTLLLILLHRALPRELLLLTATWMILQFYSSQVSLPFLNLFQGLAKLFPFLLRTRGIHSEYILALLFFAVSAYGFSYFLKRFKRKKIVLALVCILVFAERLRWPIHAEKLTDDRPVYNTLYRTLAGYPDHFGLLELPFYPQSSNHYPLYTIHHDLHTYHGNIFYLRDYYDLNTHAGLHADSGFSGLDDPQFIQTLKARGIRLILLFKDKIFANSGQGQRAWLELQKRIRTGAARGLFEKVEKTNMGILLVLREWEQGEVIRYFLPHYSLMGKKTLRCSVKANGESPVDFFFNDKKITRQTLPANGQVTVSVDLATLPLLSQFNYLEIRSGPSLELLKVRTD